MQEDKEKAVLALTDEEFDAEYIDEIGFNTVCEEEVSQKQLFEAIKKADESLEYTSYSSFAIVVAKATTDLVS